LSTELLAEGILQNARIQGTEDEGRTNHKKADILLFIETHLTPSRHSSNVWMSMD